MSLIQLIDFKKMGDASGVLVALESNNEIPFDIKRVYYVFGTKEGVARGFHAHKKTRQVAVCVAGSCKMIMDNGVSQAEVVLDSPCTGILIDRLMWHEMHDFSDV